MRSRVIVAALAALLLVASAGCSDEKDEPGATRTATTSPAVTDPASASESPSGPEAATGPLMELDETLSLRVPGGEGWNVMDGGGQTLTASFRVEGGGFFDVGGGVNNAEGWSLEESARLQLQLHRDDQVYPSYKHTGNREIDGVEVWVIEARDKEGRLYQVVGVHNDKAFRVDFEWPHRFTGGEELKEQILASVEWK